MSKLERVIACFKEVGFKPNIGTFQDRLVIQKTVCLLELLGFNTGYKFSLYVHGPYSPALTQDLYHNVQTVQELSLGCVLAPTEKDMISKVFEISNGLSPKMLEIMATYAFLSKILKKSPKEATIELKRLKPSYSEAERAVGASRAKELLFAPSEKEIKSMRSEYKLWENASLKDGWG